MRRSVWMLAAALCLFDVKFARTEAQAADSDYGTVSGHVTLADSNAPARFSLVTLQPIDVKPEPTYVPGKIEQLGFHTYQTGIDGGYLIPYVRPGTYYVVVNRPGYLSPIAKFSITALQHPTAKEQMEIESSVPKVVVAANARTIKDIRLVKGASIAGAVRFDDGTPLPRVRVQLRQKDDAGKWVWVPDGWAATDSEGRYRVSGLFAGDYLLSVNLDVDDRRQSSALGGSSSSNSFTLYSLRYYGLGDVLRIKDATPVTLVDGLEADGQDITIPVSKLHALSGAVVDARTGRGVNAGRVELLNADDGTTVTSANIDAETRSFRFPFIPEGSYILRIADAREVVIEKSSVEPVLGVPPRQTVVQAYEKAEMPLVVNGETDGVTLPVQPAASR